MADAHHQMQQELSPSAPPRQQLHQGFTEESPPNYDALLDEDPEVRNRAISIRNRAGLTTSLGYAGAAVGRFFGVHDDDLGGWRRTGTLPQNRAALGYNMLPQENGTEFQEGRRSQVAAPPDTDEELIGQRRGRNRGNRRDRLHQVRSTVANTLRRRRNKDPTREEVMKTLPTFWPVMTCIITMIEVILFIAVIITGDLAPIKFSPETVLSTVVGFDNRTESVRKYIVPNFFIGTSKASLINSGAMYTPCMRENIEFQVQAAKDRLEENNLRCCLSQQDQCGMLPQEICTGTYGGQVLGGASRCRAELNNTNECEGGVTLHPCCYGLLGGCVVTTWENCTFQEGFWHPEALLCSDVGTDCFTDICRFTWNYKLFGRNPSQGLRFFSAIFLYDGVVILLIIGLFKLYNSWSIERRIGWLRIMCIYIISGIGGFMLSGIFDPTSVSVGGTGGLFGLLGVLLVELLQGWKWVKKPCVELLKQIILIVILLALGTLPYVDNFTQIGGFIFGVLASFIFVPYITIGKWDRAKKLCLLSFSVPIILALFLFGFVVFYNLPDPNFCPKCSYINCIPYTSNFCEDFIGSVLSGIIPAGAS